MDLQQLFETQAKLDARIVEEKELQGQDLLDEKTLALQVELGELANELPEVFKFWSHKKNNYEKALIEYCDCLHFILSIGLELGANKWWPDYDEVTYVNKSGTITDYFLEVQYGFLEMCVEIKIMDLGPSAIRHLYSAAFDNFNYLGEILGFTWQEIENAYYNKNEINHQRQENGY